MSMTYVTTYDRVVNNDNLEYFDSFQFRVDWSKFGSMAKEQDLYTTTNGYIFAGAGCTVKALSNGKIWEQGIGYHSEFTFNETPTRIIRLYPIDESEITEFVVIGTPSRLWASSYGGFTCKNFERAKFYNGVTKWDNGARIYAAYPGKTTDLSFIGDVIPTTVTSISFSGDWHDYPNYPFECPTEILGSYTNLTVLSWLWCPYGDAYYLRNMTALTNLQIKSNVNGNITAFGAMTALTALSLKDKCQVYGSIEDFVAAQCDAGRTNGSIVISCGNYTNITFNGSRTILSNKTLSWTSKTDIVIS